MIIVIDDRSKEASRRLIVYCLVYSFVFVAFLYIFPNAFASLFNDNENILKICEKMIRIMFIGLAFMGIQIGCQNSFLALGKSKISLILAFLRKIILLIPLMYILPLFLGSDGVFISESVADLLAIAITLLCYILLFNKYLKEKF